jgi:ParB/RepB/Spo0J family partition protein
MNTKQIKMSGTKARKVNTNSKKANKPELSAATREALEKGIHESIPLELIDFNPKNRKYYKQNNLESFAEVLKKQGQIHEIIVVNIPGGRFKLIVGERRVKSMRIAKFKTIRANIVNVTEAQEKEIMFSENADRENSHPLDDAAWIVSMQNDNYPMEEIALRLVRPLSFVYNRIKLSCLIEPFKEMFVEEKMNLKEALQLAALSEESQELFFTDHCSNWKENEYFSLEGLDDVLDNYVFDLQKAPFDTTAETLLPDKGACTNCKFNSASVAVLFPEMAKQSICSDTNCYSNKCSAHYHIKVLDALLNDKPECVIFTSHFSDDLKTIIRSLPETASLPTVDYYQVNEIQPPEEPKKETYTEINDKEEVEFFDETEYKKAFAEYEADKQEFELMIHSGEVQKGLFVGQKEIKVSYFKKQRHGTKSNIPQQTKKQVDDAIKTNTATAKLLEDEIIRMTEKRKRGRELMKEKVQMDIHKKLTVLLKKPSNCTQLVDADIIATRIIIYTSLSFDTTEEVNNAFGIDRDFGYEKRYEILSQLSEEQTAFLIRKAIQGKSDSKCPQNLIGYCLYKHSENWGIDTKEIEAKQEKITSDEEKAIDERIEEMNARLESMKIKAA